MKNSSENKQRRDSHIITVGGWKSRKEESKLSELSGHEVESKYANYPLVRDMILNERIRNAALKKDGAKQIFYPKSNDGWLRTLLVLEGRALDRIMLPWALVTLNAIAWTVIVEEWKYEEWKHIDVSSYESYFGLALNSSLSFLLVFRLNRSAERYWAARTSWGAMVACGRSMVSGVLVHGSHDKENRDAVIKWIASHSVITMHYIRGITNIVPETVSGILGESEIKEMKAFDHPGLFATDQIRWHLKEIFKIDKDTPFGIAQGRSQQLDTLEKQLNKLSLEMGALERIKSTPLPIVYVSHLRTFLLCFLFSLPYIWETALGYATIPLVFVTAFALLGLEGAAQEVESPFQKDRTNHLSMDSYCLMITQNILQQIRHDADRDIRQKAEEEKKANVMETNKDITRSEHTSTIF